jgi:predicted sugar kinase
MIVEAGRGPGEGLSPLVARIELPPTWRFLLVRPNDATGLSGSAEERAFAELPPVPALVTARLCQELLLGLMPAARAGDFAAFSASLRRYGHEAGMCFAARQAGAFASAKVAALAARIRNLGVEGVGQSSWGPTLYAVLPNEADARRLAAELSAGDESLDLTIAQPAASGAIVEVQRADARAGRTERAPVG